jgi:hypothetical protein
MTAEETGNPELGGAGEELSNKDAPRPRKAVRVNLRTFVHLRKAGYHRTEVTLLDVSAVGCRVDLPERVTAGETVWVTLPGLQPIETRVAWARDWTAGLQFENPLYPAVFEALVERLRAK